MMTAIIICAVLYALWVLAYLNLEHRRQRRKPMTTGRKNRVPPEEIMGKSLFSMRHSQPQTATKPEVENPENKEHSFAPETEKRSPARVPDEELDEAFSNNGEIEVEEVALEYEDDEQINLDEEEEEFADYSTYNGDFASGILYEDTNEAVCIAGKESPTVAEEQKAGETFSAMEGNDLYEKLMRNADQLSVRIKELIDNSIKGQGKTEHLPMPDDIEDFDIRNFI